MNPPISPNITNTDTVELPDFAVICSFIEVFQEKLELRYNIKELKDALESKTTLDENLVELHMRLIRKMRRYVVRDKWEEALFKFALEYSYEAAKEIDEVGYLQLKISTKLELLKRLLESQFDYDNKFRSILENIDAEQLRVKPTGRDKSGNVYWTSIDNHCNIRVFKESPVQRDSWSLACNSRETLDLLIGQLDGQHTTTQLEETNDVNIKQELMLEQTNDDKIKQEQILEQTNKLNERIKRQKLEQREEEAETSTLINNKEQDETNNNDEQEEEEEDKKVEEEKQVKSTIESLINRVVSSFENFIKPFTGTKRKKPSPKKIIIPREDPPRRSSRIKKIEVQKQIEVFKQIESTPKSLVPEVETEPIEVKSSSNSCISSPDISVLNSSQESQDSCLMCKKSNHPETILLCDKCDVGYHTACCIPPLYYVPDGEWYCLNCEQIMLLEKLKEYRTTLQSIIEEHKLRELKRQQQSLQRATRTTKPKKTASTVDTVVTLPHHSSESNRESRSRQSSRADWVSESSYSDDEIIPPRRRATQQVCYKESSDDNDSTDTECYDTSIDELAIATTSSPKPTQNGKFYPEDDPILQ